METWLVSSSHVESLVHFTSTSGKFLWCAGNIIYKTYWVPISWSFTLTLSLAVSKSGVALRTYSYSAFIPPDQKVYVEVKSWYRTHRHASFMAFGATCNISTSHPEMRLAGSWCGGEKAMPVRESNGCSFLTHYSLVPLSQARSKLNLSGPATP